jgi:hypothetical protein
VKKENRTYSGANVALCNVGIQLTGIALINVFAQRINYDSTKAVLYAIIRYYIVLWLRLDFTVSVRGNQVRYAGDKVKHTGLYVRKIACSMYELSSKTY